MKLKGIFAVVSGGWIILSHLLAQPVSAISNPVFINFGMPDIELDGEVSFNDKNNNNTLDASERAQFSFYIKNVGKYVANRVKIRTVVGNDMSGIILPGEISLGNMAPNERKLIKRVIEGGQDLQSGVVKLRFEIIENDSLAEVVPFDVNTYSISKKPRLDIISHGFFTKEGSQSLKPDTPFELKIRLKNNGGGTAQNIRFEFKVPPHILINSNLDDKVIEKLDPNEIENITFNFYMGVNYRSSKIPIGIKVYDDNTDSGESRTFSEPVIMNNK